MEKQGYQKKASDNTAFESEDNYTERMRGIICIYAAITQTPFKYFIVFAVYSLD